MNVFGVDGTPVAYIFAQLMGGIVGAALVYRNYIHAIDIFEGGHNIRTRATAGLFATYAVSRTCVWGDFY